MEKQNVNIAAFGKPENNEEHYCQHLPHRKNIRAKFHDYSGGIYFVTICTYNKFHFFGEIYDGKMHLSDLGMFAHNSLQELPSHYSYVEVPLFVVMPNHIHAIIAIDPCEEANLPTIRTALGVVVGGYKQAVTRYARRNNIVFDWQSRYYDHIIRNASDGNQIADYIQTNVIRWTTYSGNNPHT